ncbi:hypothetical protein EV360DRAFT_80416 [Lentinula raphanica]|nr:hypothetical protein EV360DRAFT_80416 [Lentinula raphanica]
MNPLDIIDAAEKTVELGKALHKRYNTYIHANDDLKSLDNHLQTDLFVLQAFQNFIQTGMSSLSRRQQEEIGYMIDSLQGAFDRLDKQLSYLPPDRKLDIVGKLRWTFRGKSGFEAILQELNDWQSRAWFIIGAMKLLQEPDGSEEERALYRKLFASVERIGSLREILAMDDVVHGHSDILVKPINKMDVSCLQTTLIEGDRQVAILGTQNVFVEARYFEERSSRDIQESVQDVEKLAQVLHNVDPASMHILHCIGTVFQESFPRSLLLYDIPIMPAVDAQWTLATALKNDKGLKPSLEVRIRFAVEISMAVMFTHSAGLVHKSIYPDNVLILENPDVDQCKCPVAVENHLGFDAARLRDLSAYSEQVPETDDMRKLYHHPDRQDASMEGGHVVRYGIRHDMYSLGIVLLELGMWKPVHKITRTLHDLAKNVTGTKPDPKKWQEALISAADANLAGAVGSKYTDAVLCCLKDTAVPTRERQMREVFYERVLKQLKQIAV